MDSPQPPISEHNVDVEKTTELTGLSNSEVAQRRSEGKTNVSAEPEGRSVAQIVRANVLTPVNAIMIILFVLVVISGHWQDGLFVGVVFSNSVLGIGQEVKARRELARLQVLTQADATVIRDGVRSSVELADIVLDDIIVLSAGAQLPVDGEIVSATGLQFDESELTGESLPVAKIVGDEANSGSFVIAGNGIMRATAVGLDSFAAGLTAEAKTFRAAESELRRAVNKILKWLTIIIPISSGLLLLVLLDTEERWQDALQGTVAAAVAMVPDGLVLLTSLAFVAGVLELTRRNALASQLSTVEVLARVDVLCLDKTGTITTGDITYGTTHVAPGLVEGDVHQALAAMAAADEAPNATMAAIAPAVGPNPGWQTQTIEPFSSKRKWSAVCFKDQGWFFLGAPDVLLAPEDPMRSVVEERSAVGKRLVALAASNNSPDGDSAPEGLTSMAIVELEDEIRPDAQATLQYFADQDVTIKVISGDNQETVAAIAERAGVSLLGDPVDARTLGESRDEVGASLEARTVFGRVAPRQKQEMVKALQERGHVVAMTGDGVNDVLALKDADLGIAMGSGSAASRSAADLVLTDNAFATLPVVVNEGRKVINNVERVANLFVTKAVYAVALTVLTGVLASPFPFLPRQLTLIGAFSIGLPGLLLALAPEVERVRVGFLSRVLQFSIPAGLAAGTATFGAYEFARRTTDINIDEARTLATVTLLIVGLVVLVVASRPLRVWKFALVAAMAGGYALVFSLPFLRSFFELETLTVEFWMIAAVASLLATLIISLIPAACRRFG